MSTTIYRYYAAMRGARGVPAYSKGNRAIVAKMGPIAKFQTPLLAQTTTDLDALDRAEQAAHKGTPAQTADRNAKLLVVRSDMRQLKAFVQGIADSDLLNAQALIESSGFNVAKKAIRTKPDFEAVQGKVTTTAILRARAVKRRVSYMWQMSLDQKVWSDLPQTVKASTLVTGLTPSTTYYFRFRSLTAAGVSDWSMVDTLIAH